MSWQNIFTLVLPLVAMLSQLILQRWLKIKVQKGIAFAGPLLLFFLIVGLECQTIQSLLMVVYSLALCIEIIKDDRIQVAKGNKR
jgi:ABC-type proline/glycine betaine transport system permease subunit